MIEIILTSGDNDNQSDESVIVVPSDSDITAEELFRLE